MIVKSVCVCSQTITKCEAKDGDVAPIFEDFGSARTNCCCSSFIDQKFGWNFLLLNVMRMRWLRQFHHLTSIDNFGDGTCLTLAAYEIRASPIDCFVCLAIFHEFGTINNERT